jgi:hypothetical protein
VAKPVRNGAIFGSRGFASSSRSTSPCLDVGALGSFALSVIRASAKANGKTLGNYQRIAAAKQRATSERAEAARPAIEGTMHLSARAAAEELTRRDIGGKKWHAMQIVRMRRRLGLCDGASRPGRKAGDFEVWA